MDLDDVLRQLRERIAERWPDDGPATIRIVLRSGLVIEEPFPPGRPPGPGRLAPRRHSADFRSVHWDGTDYAFNPSQAAIVGILWRAWEAGTPDVGSDTLLEESGSESDRVRALFARNPAWGVLIVQGAGKGTYRLAG